MLCGFGGDLNYARERLREAEVTIRDYEARGAGEFAGQAEIDRLTKAVRELECELAPKKEEQPPGEPLLPAENGPLSAHIEHG